MPQNYIFNNYFQNEISKSSAHFLRLSWFSFNGIKNKKVFIRLNQIVVGVSTTYFIICNPTFEFMFLFAVLTIVYFFTSLGNKIGSITHHRSLIYFLLTIAGHTSILQIKIVG